MAGTLYRGDCLAILPTLPESGAALVVTSPPYNVGWPYGGDPAADLLPEAEYLALLQGALDGCWRALRPGGALVLNLPSSVAIREGHGWGETIRAYPIAALLRCWLHAQRPRWLPQDTVIWAKGAAEGAPEARAPMQGTFSNFLFRPTHEELLVFHKLTHRTAKRGWTAARYLDATKSVQWWPHGRGRTRDGDPPTFPDALAAWALDLFTDPGDVVLDPFAGTGTVGRVARALGRVPWLIEREPTYWPRLEALLGEGALLEVS